MKPCENQNKMKRTEKLNVGGFAFNVEQDAAEALASYMDSVRKKFVEDSSCDEICSDIEERIGELLSERTGEQRVVGIADVEYAKSVMGDFSTVEEGVEVKKIAHRLHRDIRTRLVGGVFSGLATYTGRDVALFRIIYALAVMASAMFLPEDFDRMVFYTLLLAYIAAWICIPAAKTVEQICSLEGKPIAISSFGDSRQVRDRKTSEVPSALARVMLAFFGLVMILAGSGLIIGCCCFEKLPDIIHHYVTDDIPGLDIADMMFSGKVLLAMTASFGLLAIWAVYAGVLLLFNLKAPSWRPGLVIFLAAFVAFLLFVIFAARAALNVTMLI